MKRMKCIGAQSIDVTEKTAPLPVIEMPCRRDDGTTHHRTFFKAVPVEEMPEMSTVQLPLFEETLGSQRC